MQVMKFWFPHSKERKVNQVLYKLQVLWIVISFQTIQDTDRIDHLIQFLDVPTYNNKDVQNKLPFSNNGEEIL